MVDGLFAVLESAVARYTMTGKIPGPLGGMHPTITPFQAFRTKDSWIVIAAGNDTLWKRFCDHPEQKISSTIPVSRTTPSGAKIRRCSARSSRRR